jgi:hypothetical protein
MIYLSIFAKISNKKWRKKGFIYVKNSENLPKKLPIIYCYNFINKIIKLLLLQKWNLKNKIIIQPSDKPEKVLQWNFLRVSHPHLLIHASYLGLYQCLRYI